MRADVVAECPRCGAEVAAGHRFCGSCGMAIDAECRTCQAPLQPGRRFCVMCGTPVHTPVGDGDAEPSLPATERRVCSILFVDLVGFTPLSNDRDAEEVRELLSKYFAATRAVIVRYGGVVEKFIGDAVMAVWGTPRALEGDTERAVRAALDVLAAIADLGQEVGATGLAGRAGVVTGEVAVNVGARDEGMVAGDAVNTAARVQAVAPSGGVLVDATTRRLASAAVGFADGGTFELKGKPEPLQLWQAIHVVSGVGGSQRVDGLEAPLIGRDREVRLLRDLLHAVVRDREPRLLVVTGPAGVGKSRLGWEFEKYVDGIADPVYWHRGRCLPVGEDTAYWALAEIVRARLGMADEDTAEVAEAKLDATLEQHIVDPTERSYVSVRLRRLLGLPDCDAGCGDLPREDLFAGWRMFFERLAATQPVLLLVEDAQFADPGLLDFVEHLVDWSRDLPILVLVFARDEIDRRRPGFGVGRRRTLVTLDPLPPAAMRELLDGLVPGLPESAADAIGAHAQGMPLFAVETVRSLIDRDVVVPRDGVYTLVADVGDLSVPESLHALLAARLDSLGATTRALVADAAIIGSAFTADTLVAIADAPDDQIRDGLAELVRRDILQVSADELSPQVGSYSFTHCLICQVAYSTLARRDRADRHIKVAEHLANSQRNEGDALADVIARHYLDALESRPAEDAVPRLRALASSWLVRAAKRAVSSGAPSSAARFYATAARLADTQNDEPSDLAAAGLLEQAARAAMRAADGATAVDHALRARELYERHGQRRLAARAATLAGRGHHLRGRPDDARLVLKEALAVLEHEPDADTVAALDALAALEALSGGLEAESLSRRALELGQQLGVDDLTLSDLLLDRGMMHMTSDRVIQASAYLRESARLAELAGGQTEVARAVGNLADITGAGDPKAAAQHAREASRIHRQMGSAWYLAASTATLAFACLATGDWDEAEAVVAETIGPDALDGIDVLEQVGCMTSALRGDLAGARTTQQQLATRPTRDDPQEQAIARMAAAVVEFVEGRYADALRHARGAVEVAHVVGFRSESFRWAWPLAARSAFEIQDRGAVDELLALIHDRRPGELAPIVRAERDLVLARLIDDGDERLSAVAAAVEGLRRVGSPYHLALGLLDQARAAAGLRSLDEIAGLTKEAIDIARTLGAPHVEALAQADVTLSS